MRSGFGRGTFVGSTLKDSSINCLMCQAIIGALSRTSHIEKWNQKMTAHSPACIQSSTGNSLLTDCEWGCGIFN